MSLVFNMVGGSGGSLKDTDAVLIVTAPTGSTVTATKGGVTLTPTMWVQAADNTLDCALFVIPPSLFDAQNAWTVTATLSGDTASDTVTIATNKQYDLVLSEMYLFKSGTGLMNGFMDAYDSPSGYSKDSAKIVWSTGTSYGASVWFTPSFKLDPYNTLYFELKITGRYGSGYNALIGVGSNTGISYSNPGAFSASTTVPYFQNSRQIVNCDIASITGYQYVKLGAYGVTGELYNVWVE